MTSAYYTPIAGGLRYRVLVVAERSSFGHHEWLICTPDEPKKTCWVRVGLELRDVHNTAT